MQLPAIREKILQLPRSQKYLFLSLLMCGCILILIIFIEIIYFFYFGYHRKVVTAQGVKTQVRVRGQKADLIAGRVVKVKDAVFTIEEGGERIDLNIVGGVLYCGEKESAQCSQIEASEIREGQFLTAQIPGLWNGDVKFKNFLRNNMLVRVWD